MNLGLEGKVALVAASSRGLGRATAEGFAREGVDVVMCARGEEELEEAARDIRNSAGRDVLAVPADLTESEEIDRLVESAIDEFGKVDVLVNNAGGPPSGYFMDLGDEDWLDAFHLNFLSAVRLTRSLLPQMRERKWGRIVNITSISVKQPIDSLILSNSIRLSVVGMAKTISRQCAEDNVLVNNVCPSSIYTQRVEDLYRGRAEEQDKTFQEVKREAEGEIPVGRLGRPEELANLIVFLGSERASYITGTTIQVDGGHYRGVF